MGNLIGWLARLHLLPPMPLSSSSDVSKKKEKCEKRLEGVTRDFRHSTTAGSNTLCICVYVLMYRYPDFLKRYSTQSSWVCVFLILILNFIFNYLFHYLLITFFNFISTLITAFHSCIQYETKLLQSNSVPFHETFWLMVFLIMLIPMLVWSYC